MKIQGNLRIIAGADRGRRLQSPRNESVRPTAGMAREAIFSILQDRTPGSHFLDLYAGTGSVGLEALSRGAQDVTLVEHNRAVYNLLRGNIKSVSRPQDCILWSSSVPVACEEFARRKKKWDLIFIDPPYEEEGISLIQVQDLLTESGVLMHQRPAKWAVGDPFAGTRLVQFDLRRYGKTLISFWSHRENLVFE